MFKVPVSTSVSKLLDSEGFISRECPNVACQRQFRVHNEGGPEQKSYVCPYCARSADADAWWTKEQAKFQEDVMAAVAEAKFGELFDKVARRSGGRTVSRGGSSGTTPRLPPHANATRLVTPPCHPTALLKVREDWQKAIHCFACGAEV